jgi:hypothetical protein
MPRYFFNIHLENSIADTVGVELPDDKAAWREATLFAGELFKDAEAGFEPGQDWFLEVTDERRNPIYFIRVSGEEI